MRGSSFWFFKVFNTKQAKDVTVDSRLRGNDESERLDSSSEASCFAFSLSVASTDLMRVHV